MGINFKDKVCVITGTLPGMSRRQASARLKLAGARVSGAVSSKTDYLIAGSGVGSKMEDARMRGITVLNAEQMLAALEGRAQEAEALATPAPAKQEVALNDALVELRQLLYDTPDQSVWKQITALLDACPEASLPMAVDYVNSLVQHWPSELPRNSRYRRYRPDGPPDQELRAAPRRWQEQMTRGEDSPKFKVLRLLEIHNGKVTGKMAMNLLSCAQLQNLRYLSLGHNKLSGGFLAALRQAEQFGGLTHLLLDNSAWGIAHARAWQGPSALKSLWHLDLSQVRMKDRQSAELLLQAEAWHQLRSLNLNQYSVKHAGVGDVLQQLSHMPHLEELRIGWTRPSHEASLRLLQEPGRAALRHLDVGQNESMAMSLPSLAQATHIQSLRYLNLSSCQVSDEGCASILSAPHLASLEALHLSHNPVGPHSAQALRDASHLTRLHTLSLHGVRMSAEHVQALAQGPLLGQLAELTFSSRNQDAQRALLEGLLERATSGRLRRLNLLGDCAGCEEALLEISRLPQFAALESLELTRRVWSPGFKKKLLESPVFSAALKERFQWSLPTQA